jgi:GLPGLI family protein
LFNWKLLSDTDTLQGYPVQKATCKFGGRKWEAWFTTEIPYNDGPYKFNGLPGLIIKVFDNKHNYVFEMVKIEKIESEMMIDKVEKDYIIKTTKKGFQRARKNFWGNIDIRAKEAGLGRKVQKHVLRVASQRNNPIELLPE